jgi:hypothetical protein
LGDVEVADVDVVGEESVGRLDVQLQFHPDLGEIVLRHLGHLSAGWGVEEHVANHQGAAVLRPELAVELPAQRVEFGLGLLRVVGHRSAVVLVAVLAGDEDVVAQRGRIVHQTTLGDVHDGLAVDAFSDCLA